MGRLEAGFVGKFRGRVGRFRTVSGWRVDRWTPPQGAGRGHWWVFQRSGRGQKRVPGQEVHLRSGLWPCLLLVSGVIPPPPRFGGGLTARPQGTAAPVSGAAGGSRVFPARQLISAAAGKVSCFLNVLLVLQRNFCVNFCQLFYCAKWFVLKIFSPFFPSKIFVNFLKKQFVSHKKHGTIGKGRALGALAERRFPPLEPGRQPRGNVGGGGRVGWQPPLHIDHLPLPSQPKVGAR